MLAILAALLYLTATGLHLLHMRQRRPRLSAMVITLGVIALLCHALVAWFSVFDGQGVHLGLYKILALVTLVVNLACVVWLLRRPLQNLLVVLLPISAAAVLVSAFAPQTGVAPPHMGGGVLLHVASSILAYAVLTLAAVQAALLAVQDHQLKHRHATGMVSLLPPLQLMETMLFELLWAGVVLLTVAIVSGLLFLEDLFAQHLVHKTVLTLLAWAIYSTLLWGRYQLGWRSQTAVRFTLGGFTLLVLAFFGSKLVLELVLQRG
ncbi:cytochrome C assembly family protein [Kineobactrum salinum]|uniref:cytochrome C assembly family protein n=1 Tax=Kineobactrum salinum TaxID=2708301 RepID=UPI001E59CD72|nr:cytochrome c biogenesis protein CcsA [Kineobactrum salinum]